MSRIERDEQLQHQVEALTKERDDLKKIVLIFFGRFSPKKLKELGVLNDIRKALSK